MDRLRIPRFALAFLTAILCWDALVAACAEDQASEEYSFSVTQAKKRGTLISKVRMIPSSINWKKWTITVGDAWLEKSKKGGCYLCFRIVGGREAFMASTGDFLVLGDSKASGVKTHWGQGWTQAVQHLDSSDLSKVRFSLVGSWQEERLKNIQFIPSQ